MYKEKSIGVVIPAHNEEKLIDRVIETMPDFVDVMIVVDDASQDKTAKVVKNCQGQLGEKKLILIQHDKNVGVGGAIVTGYKKAKQLRLNVVVVMAGDAQMDPGDLSVIVDPVVSGIADYAKGNRLFTGKAWETIPKIRYLGNSFLSLFTKIASGYWNIADSQSGYTAISLKTLQGLRLDDIYKQYGYPNDILVRLNVNNRRVCDVGVQPVYNIGEKSDIRILKLIPTVSFRLLKLFFWRLKEKYIIRDFHPLVFFYFAGILLFPLGLGLGGLFIWKFFVRDYISVSSIVIGTFCIISAIQMTLFAMWFDMSNNRHLNVLFPNSKVKKTEVPD